MNTVALVTREQRQESEWILSCQSGFWVVRVDSELSEEFVVNVGMHQGSVLSHVLLAVAVDVAAEFVREGALSELLCADDLVPVSDTVVGFRNKLWKWKAAFRSKCLKVDLWKTKVMVCGGITKDGISKGKVDPIGVCSLGVKTISVLSAQCGQWIHGRCAWVKKWLQGFR